MPATRYYSMVFAFTPGLTRVLLLKKSTPKWQKGKWNAPGGLQNNYESALQCAKREFVEETSLGIALPSFLKVLTFTCVCDGSLHEVTVWGVITYLSMLKMAQGTPAEPVQLFELAEEDGEILRGVPTVGYLQHLIPLTIARLRMEATYRRGLTRKEKESANARD